MANVRLVDLRRDIFRTAMGAAALGAMAAGTARPRPGLQPRVFYGGARSGNLGGPLVKIGLLQQSFPAHWSDFSLVYLLSNALYLPDFALAALRHRAIPLVVNQNGVFYPVWYPHGFERENNRIGRALEAANHVFFQSTFCKECVERFVGVAPRSYEILHNAVDTGAFAPSPDAGDMKGRTLRFLFTGKIGAANGYRLLAPIRGLAAARRGGLDVALDVAGAIDLGVLAAAQREIEHLRLDAHVTLSDPYTRTAAPALYRAADAYITTAHNDPCPNVVLEAMATGLPVLYGASGGVPELVGPDAGVAMTVPQTFESTPVPEPQAIAEGMAQIVANRSSMATAARVRALERFDLGRWIARHADVFEKLSAGRGPAS